MSARALLERLRRDTRRPTIEDLEAQAVEEERAEAYVAGLYREGAAVMVKLAQLRQLRPDSRVWMPHEREEGEPPSAAERVAAAEAHLAHINAEIERVT